MEFLFTGQIPESVAEDVDRLFKMQKPSQKGNASHLFVQLSLFVLTSFAVHFSLKLLFFFLLICDGFFYVHRNK